LHLRPSLPGCFLSSAFPTKPCMHLSPYVLHALPIPVQSIRLFVMQSILSHPPPKLITYDSNILLNIIFTSTSAYLVVAFPCTQ
jgi:hypothetical protein